MRSRCFAPLRGCWHARWQTPSCPHRRCRAYDRRELRLRKTAGPESALLVAWFGDVLGGRASRQARPLLRLDLCEREPGADRDYAQDGMSRVARQAQSVHLLPHSNANIRWVQVRVLLRDLQLPPLRALMLLECKTFGVSPDKFLRRLGHWCLSV